MKKAFNTSKIFSILFIAIGVLAIVFSILCFTADEYFGRGSYEPNLTYGGDAYTGMQNAAAQAANNIIYVNENLENLYNGLQTCFGYGLMITGLVVICSGCISLFKKEKAVDPMPEQKVEMPTEQN